MTHSRRKIKKKLKNKGRSKRRVVYDKKKTSKTFLIFVPLFILVFGILFVINLIPYKAYYIYTNSMAPVINTRDVVVIQRNIDKSTLQPNDIIAFNIDYNNNGSFEVFVHYIYEIEIINGTRSYRTISEVSGNPDNWRITDEDVVGIYILKIDKLGNLVLFLQSFVGQMVIVINIILIYVLVYVSKGSKEEGGSYI